MASSYTAAAGVMPSPTSFAWRTWYSRLLTSRIAYCDVTRNQTFYFAQAGNDSTGNGTQAAPYKTLAKAQAVHDASNGNIALLFNKGDEWNETTGLDITKNNVTVGAYGTGAKPLFSTFANALAASGWTQAGVTDRWTRTISTAVGWLRETGNDTKLFSPMRRVESTGAVESTPRSWYWASNTLHVNYGTGLNPNSATFSWTAQIADDGITASGDGILIDGVRFDGWGCIANTQSTNWGIKLLNTGTDLIVVRNCEAFYNGRHNIGQETATTGGICVFTGCSVGYCEDSGTNVSPYIAYSRDGSNEAIFDTCVTRFGQLPNGSLDPSAYTGCNAFYAHANSTNTVGLVVWYGCSCTYEAGLTSPMFAAPSAYGDLNNFPGTDSDLSTYRVLNVGFTCSSLPSTMTVAYLGFPARQANINCNFAIQIGGTNLNMSGFATGGMSINCIFDLSEHAEGTFPGRNLLVNPTPVHLFSHCHFRCNTGNSGKTFYLAYDTGVVTGVKIANSIINKVGARPVDPNITNAASNLLANASYSASNVSGDPYLVTLSASPAASAAPSQCQNAGRRGAFGLTVEFDVNWRPRSDLYSIGPVETLRIPQGLSGAIRNMMVDRGLGQEVIDAIEAGSATLSDRAKRRLRMAVPSRAISTNLISAIEAGTEPSAAVVAAMAKVFGDKRHAEWMRICLAAS